ncbi:hypothetical protein KIS4809_3137 [Bacillus sp. ZZV12-4809]|uniref:hypothetical protein n=1 Tax=Cytobacillus sp. AMY 15.2 TaxID=2939563 RepID=UPI0013F736DE|nr:hypothetical protein [Cytobacillus sp. AMY 15.2]KAF0817953.1 hypothetical protein KIS4809_3137 [Bacillus sp. ZZV12-4809]
MIGANLVPQHLTEREGSGSESQLGDISDRKRRNPGVRVRTRYSLIKNGKNRPISVSLGFPMLYVGKGVLMNIWQKILKKKLEDFLGY